ncbi:MAG: hypothetical protein ACI35O_00980 [Bacillaceae bacterium]
MKEFVGYCANCKKEIHCLDGFINGVVMTKKDILLCFECADNKKEIPLSSESIGDIDGE